MRLSIISYTIQYAKGLVVAHTRQCYGDQTIYAGKQGALTQIPVDEIIYLKADNKYVAVRTANQEYLITESLKTLEKQLPTFFVRIHRNALVALPLLQGLVNDYDDGGVCAYFKEIDEVLNVSRRRVTFIRRKLGMR